MDIKPAEIRALREAHFAAGLRLLSECLQKSGLGLGAGKRKPSGPALRLLSIIQKHGLETLT
jgi:DNA-binding transcriptional regulator YiaG